MGARTADEMPALYLPHNTHAPTGSIWHPLDSTVEDDNQSNAGSLSSHHSSVRQGPTLPPGLCPVHDIPSLASTSSQSCIISARNRQRARHEHGLSDIYNGPTRTSPPRSKFSVSPPPPPPPYQPPPMRLSEPYRQYGPLEPMRPFRNIEDVRSPSDSLKYVYYFPPRSVSMPWAGDDRRTQLEKDGAEISSLIAQVVSHPGAQSHALLELKHALARCLTTASLHPGPPYTAY